MNPIYKFWLNRSSNNLLDPSTLTPNCRINEQTGGFYTTSAYKTTDYMVVTPGAVYCIKDTQNNVIQLPYFAFYDSNKTFISPGYAGISQVIAPANAVYARLSIPTIQDAKQWSFDIATNNYSVFISPWFHPVYKDDLAIDFEQESNQQFFRRKLSGKLTFVRDEYDWISARAFDFEYLLKIFISYDGGQSWAEYWNGTFWKTDCEFDDDNRNVVVKPTVKDEYNAVLAGLEKEYDLIQLAPEIVPVKLDKRPMIQVYIPGQSVIACFLSGMWWEQECENITDENALLQTYHFSLAKKQRVVDVTVQGTPVIPEIFTGEPYIETDQGTTEYTNGAYKFVYYYYGSSSGSTVRWEIVRVSDNQTMWWKALTNQFPPSIPSTVTLEPFPDSGATGNVEIYIHDIPVYSRIVCDVETINQLTTYDIPDNDIVPNNRNYTRVIGYYFPDTIFFTLNLSATPTQYGLYQPGQYYAPPYVLGIYEFFPVSRNAWGRMSVWFAFSAFDWIVEQSARKEYTLKDAYPLDSIISVLLGQIAPGITHEGTTDYSQFLYGSNPISGINQRLFITPKSNMISLGYDQPAQKAPLTLKRITDMLRDCFRCYWFIDSQDRFRIEHIEYFRRGGAYTGTPVIGRDLTTEQVTASGKKWAFGTSKFQYDKPEMAARYQFGWMDDVTQLFEGNPIDIISKYVNPENIEQIDVSQFTSDVDYILLNPGEISKDGFVLLACIKPNFITPDGQNHSVLPSTPYVITPEWVVGNRITIEISAVGVAGTQMAVSFIDSDNNLISVIQTFTLTTTAQNISIGPIIVPDNAAKIQFSINGNSATVKVFGVYGDYCLPYVNFELDNVDHYLQNAYVAFVYLQRYYAYDMPARHYRVNGQDMYAYGIKKLKTQTLKFPALTDPNTLQLIKTDLGNGTIQKMSVNLSSRNANTTLKYDTE